MPTAGLSSNFVISYTMALIDAGRAPGTCATGQGGITRIFLGNKDEHVATISGTGTVSALTSDVGAVFYEFAFEEETGSFTETVNKENGNTSVEQSLEFFWKSLSQADRNLIIALAENCEGLMCIFEDRNGVTWIFGHQNTLSQSGSVKLRTAETTTGKAQADAAGRTVTLMCKPGINFIAALFEDGVAGIPL